jgi:hypothetical protein
MISQNKAQKTTKSMISQKKAKKTTKKTTGKEKRKQGLSHYSKDTSPQFKSIRLRRRDQQNSAHNLRS